VEAKFMDLPLGHYVNGCEWRKTGKMAFGVTFYIMVYSRYIKPNKLLEIKPVI
jgi:heme O synthase-like polyprenyltransferase